jgi:hypothetical protein
MRKDEEMNIQLFGKVGIGAGLVLVAAALPCDAQAQLSFFTNQSNFQNQLTSDGHSMLGFEDFEEADIAEGDSLGVDDPLNSATSDAFFSPGDIDPMLAIQSNLGGTDSSALNPRGSAGLVVANNRNGYFSKWVVSNFFVDATDLIFEDGLYGVGGKLISAGGDNFSTFRIDIYDMNNVLLGSTNQSVSSTSGFWGVRSTEKIGRVNFFAQGINAEGMDNIEMWSSAPVPEPTSIVLLGTGVAALIRRKKAKK